MRRSPVILAVLTLLILTSGCGEDRTNGDGLTKPKAEQKVEALNEEDRAFVAAKRKWVRDHYTENAEERYSTVKGKLTLLDTILKSNWIKPDETVKLQSLGITFGDALAQEVGLEWVFVEDEYGRDPALRLKGTSVLLFPMTMISKRIERGEDVDVYDLFGKALKGIEEAKQKYD